MNITVEKGLGDKPGPDIQDPLLTTEEAGTHRGTREIDYHEKDRILISGDGPKNTYMKPGELVEIIDNERTYRGIVKRYARTYTLSEDRKFTINSSMVIETVLDQIRLSRGETQV